MTDGEPDTTTPVDQDRRPPFEPHRRSSRHRLHSRWSRHPAVPAGDELTPGERAADMMRNRMGSWGFVFAFLAVLVLWVVANSLFRLGGSAGRHGFDPYPYILLNLFLSMLAAIQGAILLIAAKRSDQIASLPAEHDYETDLHAFEHIEALQERLAGIAESNRQLLE
jgi:uncharacterized membrane protein